jgi:hypothetical protein
MPKRPRPTEPACDPSLIRHALQEGDPGAMATLSDVVRGSLEERNRRLRLGKTHVGGTSMQGNFLYRIVKACHLFKLPPPRELVEAFQAYLEQDRIPIGASRRGGTWQRAAEYRRANPKATTRAIGEFAGVNHTTIGRWIKSGKI